MKLLITGATGLIGRAVVLRLLRDGHQIAVWSRSASRAHDQLGDIVTVIGDAPRRTDAFDRAIADADAVINLAGEPILGRRWSARHQRALRDSRVGLTQTLVDAMAAAPSPPRVLVSASAVGVYGVDVREPVNESRPASDDFVAQLCADWEAAARSAEKLGTRVALLRIGVVLDKDGGALSRMLPVFRAGIGGRLGHGHQYMPWIHLRDMVEVIVHALEHDEVSGPVNAVADSVENRVFADTLARHLQRPSMRVPAFAVRAAIGRGASIVLGGQRALPAALAASGFAFQFPNLSDALDDILHGGDRVDIRQTDEIPDTPYLRRRGARYVLAQRTVIPAPVDQVFGFFADAGNLALMTPPGLGFEILTERPIEMATGIEIDYRIGLGPIPMTWKTFIETWEPGDRFVDVQLKGPYRSWWHEHRFVADGDQTVMYDRVYYSLPLGPLGRLAHRLHVQSMLRRIFEFRSRAIGLRFGTAERLAPIAQISAA